MTMEMIESETVGGTREFGRMSDHLETQAASPCALKRRGEVKA